jgi:thymidylate synthase ThyX
MTIRAQIIADSVSREGHRLTTFQLRYPRFIHSELMTHRVFSRNASSSRAVPVARLIEDLQRDPAVPVHWGANQKGMQAGDELHDSDRRECLRSWLYARDVAIEQAQRMLKLGLHKQVANRILEPWSHINVVVTSTSWANWYALRDHHDAMPEIEALAKAMLQCHQESEPLLVEPGCWHLPYIADSDIEDACASETIDEDFIEILKKVSVARCARVSYLTHEGKISTVEEDLDLYGRLLCRSPLHASPAEHQATPDEHDGLNTDGEFSWVNPAWHGNFTGWKQLRKMLDNEYVADQPYEFLTPSRKVA